jgi:tetratricopeptide (TPR) repeat protein
VLAAFFLCSLLSSVPAFAQEPAKNPPAQQPDEFQQALTLAHALARQGRFEDALSEFTRAGKLNNDKCAECFQGVGQIYFKLGRLKEAAVAFRQAAALKPANEAEMYNVLGVVLYLQKEKATFEEAATALQRAIELSKGKLVKSYFNLGFALIKSGKEQEGIAALKKYVEVDPEGGDVGHARAVIANPKLVDAKIAASFAVKSHTGAELSIDKLRGKVVLLDFWASWCLPCRFDMPEVRKIWKKFAGDQLVIIGINLDSNRAAFEAYMKEEAITWPQYYDGLGWDNKISRLYRVYTIPHTILIDQEGVIQATGLRGEALAEKVADLLGKPNSSGSK